MENGNTMAHSRKTNFMALGLSHSHTETNMWETGSTIRSKGRVFMNMQMVRHMKVHGKMTRNMDLAGINGRMEAGMKETTTKVNNTAKESIRNPMVHCMLVSSRITRGKGKEPTHADKQRKGTSANGRTIKYTEKAQ